MKTLVYVDGYNLYYGCLRRSAHKWLDLSALFSEQLLHKNTEILKIKYYTAPILGRMSDDPESPKRQRAYLQALRKYCANSISIIEGKMKASHKAQRHLDPPPEFVNVQHFEEKQSDVNIAVDMIYDAVTRACEQVVLCTNDSDLVPAVRKIREISPSTRIGLISPILNSSKRYASHDLRQYAHWHKVIKDTHLRSSKLPDRIPHTSIQKPSHW